MYGTPSAAVHADEVPSTMLPFNYYIKSIFCPFSLGGLWHHFMGIVESSSDLHAMYLFGSVAEPGAFAY